MSTLNSSQLYVKRSSTRLHAPPGGHSSLSFGAGGFGTTDASSSDLKSANYGDPAESLPPSTGGSFRSGYGVYNHPSNTNQSTEGSYHHGSVPPVAFHAINGYGAAQGPPVSSHGYGSTGFSATPVGTSQPPIASDPRPVSTQSNYSWGERGSQPPLTSSKRDQNWEKKRRLWLARKNAGGSGGTGSATPSGLGGLPPPPATAYGGGGGGYYGHDPAVYNPPSPLTKFMAQQTHSQPTIPLGGYDAYGSGRPGSSSSECTPPPPRTATMTAYRPELTSSAGLRQGLHSSSGAYPSTAFSMGGYTVPPRTGMPGTASSTASTSRRQPPGGNSNWNPYS